MPESHYHTKMVREIGSWIKTQHPNNDIIVLMDTPETPGHQLPQLINNYRPDVFAKGTQNNIFLGEAKSPRGLETSHSIRQIKSYLRYLSDKPNSVFVLATSWDMGRCAKSLVISLQEEVSAENVSLEIITVYP